MHGKRGILRIVTIVAITFAIVVISLRFVLPLVRHLVTGKGMEIPFPTLIGRLPVPAILVITYLTGPILLILLCVMLFRALRR